MKQLFKCNYLLQWWPLYSFTKKKNFGGIKTKNYLKTKFSLPRAGKIRLIKLFYWKGKIGLGISQIIWPNQARALLVEFLVEGLHYFYFPGTGLVLRPYFLFKS